MLPGLSGIDVCRELRTFIDVPIIMITAKTEETERVLGLELGVDDYICKLLSPREVVALVKAVLRRCQSVSPPPKRLWLKRGLIRPNPETREVLIEETPSISLTTSLVFLKS